MEKFLIKKRGVEEVPSSSTQARRNKSRKYDDTYLDFGFTCTVVKNEERPQCVICLKVLAAESMLPNKLQRHLETVHSSLVGKPRDYFSRKLQEMREQKTHFRKQATIPSKALLASYKVAYRIARSKKPHTIAEELVLPAALDMVSIMIGESAAKQLASVPLSNNTISRRISDMSDDITDQITDKLRDRDFSIQLDEAVDNNNDAHFICYVRFINDDNNFHEDLLFCKDIKSGTKAVDLFEITDTFMTENRIDWSRCVGVCTDGCRSMSGQYGGLQALIREKAPAARWTHCLIHREALASQEVSPDLNEVLETIMSVVNYIKTRPQKARFFRNMCIDMGAEHTSLLYYCKSRWLSRGNVVSRVYELRNEIFLYLTEERHSSAECFINNDFIFKLAYLCDMFERLNSLNVSLQGRESHIIQLSDKILAFKRKLLLWKNNTKSGGFDCFPTLNKFIQENEMPLSAELKSVILKHLSKLHVKFDKYFPPETDEQKWVTDPFTANPPSTFTTTEQEQLIDISSDSTLKMTFSSGTLSQFWNSVAKEYPELSKKAVRVILPFATSYLCEAGFSALAVIKSRYRSKVNVEKEIRVAVSNIVPRFDILCDEKQAHPSH